jgi:hypothetical protein
VAREGCPTRAVSSKLDDLWSTGPIRDGAGKSYHFIERFFGMRCCDHNAQFPAGTVADIDDPFVDQVLNESATRTDNADQLHTFVETAGDKGLKMVFDLRPDNQNDFRL